MVSTTHRLKAGSVLLADRGDDADWIREFAAPKGAWANISRRTTGTIRFASACISTAPTTGSNVSQHIKHCRRAATRYNKLAANYLAFVQLASIRL